MIECGDGFGFTRDAFAELLARNFDRDVPIKRASRARYTCPIPPAPMGARMSYGLSLSPAESGM